tara:strand:- start:590 stop:709 length:120 start_codon:yes stop_codon:yes gene_type:complete
MEPDESKSANKNNQKSSDLNKSIIPLQTGLEGKMSAMKY